MSVEVGEDAVEYVEGTLGRLRLDTQHFHRGGVLVDVFALVQVHRAGELFDVDHVGQFGVGEAQDAVRAAGRRVPADLEWDDLDPDVGQLRRGDQRLDLAAHHLDAADRTAQGRLVDDHPQLYRFGPGEDLLPADPQLHPVRELLVGDAPPPQQYDSAGVIAGLQQPREQLHVLR